MKRLLRISILSLIVFYGLTPAISIFKSLAIFPRYLLPFKIGDLTQDGYSLLMILLGSILLTMFCALLYRSQFADRRLKRTSLLLIVWVWLHSFYLSSMILDISIINKLEDLLYWRNISFDMVLFYAIGFIVDLMFYRSFFLLPSAGKNLKRASLFVIGATCLFQLILQCQSFNVIPSDLLVWIIKEGEILSLSEANSYFWDLDSNTTWIYGSNAILVLMDTIPTILFFMSLYSDQSLSNSAEHKFTKKRPISVTIICWLLILLLVIGFLVTYWVYVMALSGEFVDSIIWLLKAVLVASVLQIIIAVGMLRGKNWARLFFLWLTPVSIVIGFLGGKVNPGSLLKIVRYIAFAVILTRPHAVEYFHNSSLSANGASEEDS